MRMLSGVEAPDAGTRTEGHQLVMQYFAQDEAAKLDPTLTVYQTLAGDSPIQMVPHIRTILGGFLFSGDDIDKPVRVLSGGERTRLAVARMLLRPANTLLLDEPTNHLDLDSKDVLLEALEDFGGTLIFVSHDRYFVDKLATKVIDIGRGDAVVYPGNYEEWLWSKKARAERSPGRGSERPQPEAEARRRSRDARVGSRTLQPAQTDRKSNVRPQRRKPAQSSYEEKKKADAEARKVRKDAEARQRAHQRARGPHRARRRPASRSWRPPCRPRVSTRTTRPPSRSSTGTRR